MKEYYSINENNLYNNYYNYNLIENFEIFKGPDGTKGERGYEGIRGLQGLQGERGYKGNMGDTGDRGPVGYQGNEGTKGIKGIDGKRGEMGAEGLTGFRGERGIFGTMGPKGFRGAKGIKGRQGRQRYRGLQGPRGDMGNNANNNVSLGTDETGVSGLEIHGFVKSNDVFDYRAGMSVPDPRKQGSTTPALVTNYKAGLEAECTYNGYISGLSWQARHLSGKYVSDVGRSSGSGTDTNKVTDINHLNKRTQTGLPHVLKIDCKKVNVNFN